jgi:hypothetical protein
MRDLNTENVVLWAGSEINGLAIIECEGLLEKWNVGILGLAE